MKYWERFKIYLRRWMAGRHGSDQLGMATLLTGLFLSLLGSMTRSGTFSFFGLALYVITLFRMFSRNEQARSRENLVFLELTGKWRLKGRQFILRLKNRKDYKYFRCPQCRQLLRLKKGCGVKEITCAKCGHSFSMKA